MLRPGTERHHPAGDLFQLFVFLLFNAGDAVGRALAGLHQQSVQPSTLFAYAGLRTAIVIGLAFCNVVPSRPWRLPASLWCVPDELYSVLHSRSLPVLVPTHGHTFILTIRPYNLSVFAQNPFMSTYVQPLQGYKCYCSLHSHLTVKSSFSRKATVCSTLCP